MSTLDQVFLKVFQEEDADRSRNENADSTTSPVDTPRDESPRTISFPAADREDSPQVVAFERESRKHRPVAPKEKSQECPVEDTGPSRKFRRIYAESHQDSMNAVDRAVAPETQTPSLKVVDADDENDESTGLAGLPRKRQIQEQALRLLMDHSEVAVDWPSSVPDTSDEHVIPIGQALAEQESSDRENTTADHDSNDAGPAVVDAVDTEHVLPESYEEHDEYDEYEEKIVEFVPPVRGSIPRACRNMLARASAELSTIGDVLHKTIHSGHKVIGFKGTCERCGSSTLLLGAAAELASRGLAVLVVDGNFEHPNLGASLGMKDFAGWDDAVFRKLPLETAMVRINFPIVRTDAQPERDANFFRFLPLAPQTVSRAIVASCKKEWLHRILDLSDQFDIVLIDTGSYAPDSMEEKIQEMLRFGIDGFFLVKDTRGKSYACIPELVDVTRRFDLACLGIIENFT